MSTRKRKGPGEKGEVEMVEDDEVIVEEENTPNRLADKPSPNEESSGSAMPPPGSSGSRSRLQGTLVKETFSLAGEYELIISKLVSKNERLSYKCTNGGESG